MTDVEEKTTDNVTVIINSTNITAENSEVIKKAIENALAVPATATIAETTIDLDSLTEEKVLSMTEEEITEVKEQAKLFANKAETLNGYLKALAWKVFKAKFTWTNIKTVLSNVFAKVKTWLSKLDPIARYIIYALILAKIFNII